MGVAKKITKNNKFNNFQCLKLTEFKSISLSHQFGDGL